MIAAPSHYKGGSTKNLQIITHTAPARTATAPAPVVHKELIGNSDTAAPVTADATADVLRETILSIDLLNQVRGH